LVVPSVFGTLSEEKKRDRKNWGSVQHHRRLDPAVEFKPTPEETAAQAAAVEAEADAAVFSVAHVLTLEREYNAAALVRKAELAVISAAACAKALAEAAEAAMEVAEEAVVAKAEHRTNKTAASSSSSSSSSSSALPLFLDWRRRKNNNKKKKHLLKEKKQVPPLWAFSWRHWHCGVLAGTWLGQLA
jgi:hypothetical protein